jgi:hypothetical protein
MSEKKMVTLSKLSATTCGERNIGDAQWTLPKVSLYSLNLLVRAKSDKVTWEFCFIEWGKQNNILRRYLLCVKTRDRNVFDYPKLFWLNSENFCILFLWTSTTFKEVLR